MTTRHRCLITGCNPYLADRARNRSGYYAKYNIGAKAYETRAHLIEKD